MRHLVTDDGISVTAGRRFQQFGTPQSGIFDGRILFVYGRTLQLSISSNKCVARARASVSECAKFRPESRVDRST